MNSSPPETRMSLIARLQDPDDIAAWDNFSDLYAPIIYRSARRLGLQAADADDVVQEVLTAVTRSVSRWIKRNDRGPFRAWLFRIARNKSIDFLTRRKHRPWATGGDTAAQQLDHAKAPVDVSSQFDFELRRTMFVQASEIVRARVSETTWEAFHRTSVLQEPVEDVAKQLGVSVGSVYISRSRVMKRLQNEVKSFEEQSHGEM